MVAANDLMRERRAYGEPFDAVLEYWWNDASQLRSVLNSEQCGVLMQSMLDFQRRFVDLEKSCAFFTEAQE